MQATTAPTRLATVTHCHARAHVCVRASLPRRSGYLVSAPAAGSTLCQSLRGGRVGRVRATEKECVPPCPSTHTRIASCLRTRQPTRTDDSRRPAQPGPAASSSSSSSSCPLPPCSVARGTQTNPNERCWERRDSVGEVPPPPWPKAVEDNKILQVRHPASS